jgi:hypothetical protein
MDQPPAPDRPGRPDQAQPLDRSAQPGTPPQGDIGDPVAVRGFLLAALLIVIGMALWAFAMIGY